MNSNPIVERQQEAEEEYRRKKDFRYPFRICCVYMPSEGHDFPIFHEVKKYCDQNNLTFAGRPYDIDKYEEDMVVKRLLAFHIYYKGYIQETHYYDTDPVHKIQLVVWAYQDEEKEKARKRQRRQERWDSIKESWNSLFTLDHFKRKAALDLDASQSKDRLREIDGKTIYPKSGGVD